MIFPVSLGHLSVPCPNPCATPAALPVPPRLVLVPPPQVTLQVDHRSQSLQRQSMTCAGVRGVPVNHSFFKQEVVQILNDSE